MSVKGIAIRCPLKPSERSGKPTEVSRRLFAYFLVGEKVGPRRDDMLPRSFDSGFAYAQDDAFRGMLRLFELLDKPGFVGQRKSTGQPVLWKVDQSTMWVLQISEK